MLAFVLSTSYTKNSILPTTHRVDTNVTPISQMKKLRLREVEI